MDNEGNAMRKQMDVTRDDLTGKLEELEYMVSATVRTVKDSVNSVRDTFDLKLHMRQRPWTLLAGATALGFLGGMRSGSHRSGHTAEDGKGDNATLARADPDVHPHTRVSDISNGKDPTRPATAASPSWLANLGSTFQPEITELKGIVLGSLIELVREIVTKQVSKSIARPVGARNNGSNSSSGQSSGPKAPYNNTADV